MLDKFALLTDNFYKFLTTLSLLLAIYCASFSELFIQPYNDRSFKENKELARLTNNRWMLEGVKAELFSKLGDTANLPHYDYSFYWWINDNEKDTAHVWSRYYYKMGVDSAKDALLDTLNKTFYAMHTLQSQIMVYTDHHYHERKNIMIRETTTWILGVVALLVFIFSMYRWYRLQKSQDAKRGDNEIVYNIRLLQEEEPPETTATPPATGNPSNPPQHEDQNAP